MNNSIAHIEIVSGESQADFNNTLAETIQRIQSDLNLNVEVQFSTSANAHTKPRTSLVQSSIVYSALLIGRVKDSVLRFEEPVEFHPVEDVEVINDAELITE